MTAENSNLPNNIIRRMTTDANGTIWISMQGSLNAYQNGKWISYSTDQGLPSNDITVLTIAGSQVWVGMRDSFGLLSTMAHRSRTAATTNGKPLLIPTLMSIRIPMIMGMAIRIPTRKRSPIL